MVRISDILKKKRESSLAPERAKNDAPKPAENKPEDIKPQEAKPGAMKPEPVEQAAPPAPEPPVVVSLPPAQVAAPEAVPMPLAQTEPPLPAQIPPAPEDKGKPWPLPSKPQAPNPQEMQIAKVMRELGPDMEQTKELYSQGIQTAQGMLKSAESRSLISIRPIKELVEEMVNCFVLGDKTLITFFYEDNSPDDYLAYHTVNVLIMSIAVGVKLGYNKGPLNELGLAAFLHDVGMARVGDIALKPRVLSKEEYSYIQEHPQHGHIILSEIRDLSVAVINTVAETHERLGGEGYPKGLKGGQISEHARIISTVDIYEALTHTRSFRKKFPVYEAVKQMASFGQGHFDTRIFKVLIDVVGIYPVGSYAQLNTDEIVKVVTPNNDFPLRPVINIIFDAEHKRLEEPHLVNLAKQFNLYIKKPLSKSSFSADF